MTLDEQRQTLADYLTSHGAVIDWEYPSVAITWNDIPGEVYCRIAKRMVPKVLYVCFRGHYMRDGKLWKVGIGARDDDHACATVQDARISGETDLASIPDVNRELLALCRDALALLSI